MKSLKMKLVFFVLIMSLVITVVISAVGLTSVSKAANDTLKEMVVPLALQTATSISSDLSYYTKSIEKTTSSSVLKASVPDKNQIFTEITNEARRLESSSYTLYDSDDKSYITLDSDIGDSVIQMDFYKLAKENGQITISDPIKLYDGKLYFVIAAPIFNIDNQKINYILTLYYTFDKVNTIVSKIEFGDTGRGYLINNEGLTVADSDIDNVNNSFNAIEAAKTDKNYKGIANVYENIFSSESDSGFNTYKLKGETQVVGFATVPNTAWSLIITAPKNEFLKTTSNTIFIFGILALGILIVVSVITYIIVKNIVLPVVTTTNRLKSLSEGNLTDPVEVSNQKNEIGILSASLEETVYSLKQYIDKISDALNNIASGNLSFEMQGNFRGDFVKIKTSFNSILASLRETFSRINDSAEQVNNGAVQVSNGSQALSQGASEQSSSIEELSTQIYDISEQVNANADASSKTDGLVDNITNQINSCNEDMNRMLSSMADINSSSTEISKIIKVIDDIAFQTNILALNAAVEAARAGNAGKGFAVVADEVRNLAAKSAEAAKQTTVLIEGSVSNVKKGRKIAKDTASALDNIVASASEISEKIKSIAAASKEQSDSITKINLGVDQISAVVQTNSATAEESAAASEELSSQSAILKDMISKFKFSENFEKDEDNFDDYGYGTETMDFESPANSADNSLSYASPQDQTFDFGTPVAEDKPFDFGEPYDDKPFQFDQSENEKPFEFDNTNEPFEFEAPSKINLDDDFKNDDGKY